MHPPYSCFFFYFATDRSRKRRPTLSIDLVQSRKGNFLSLWPLVREYMNDLLGSLPFINQDGNSFFCTNLGRSSISLPRQEKISVPPPIPDEPTGARDRQEKRQDWQSFKKEKKKKLELLHFRSKKGTNDFLDQGISWPTPASRSRGNKGRVVRGRRSADRYETLTRGPFDGTSPELRHTHTHFNPLQLDYQLNKSLFFAFNQRDEMVYIPRREHSLPTPETLSGQSYTGI